METGFSDGEKKRRVSMEERDMEAPSRSGCIRGGKLHDAGLEVY
jgi:hypothetical protein